MKQRLNQTKRILNSNCLLLFDRKQFVMGDFHRISFGLQLIKHPNSDNFTQIFTINFRIKKALKYKHKSQECIDLIFGYRILFD